MPATYTKRGKGSADFAPKSWKAEPPKRRPPQYFICGIEVPYDVYREFADRNYTVKHDTLGDITYPGLSSLGRFASDEHAKEYPVEAASARAVIECVRAEVIERINGGKTDKMTPKTAADYISALSEIYNESRQTYDAAHKALVAAKTAVEQTRGNTDQVGVARHQMAVSALTVAQDQFHRDFNDMEIAHDAKIRELRNQFEKALADHYAAKPEALDSATMQLLNLGICSADDMMGLVNRHANNPTMVRAIGTFAEKALAAKHISTADRAGFTNICKLANASKDGSRELAIFDAASNAAKNGLGKDKARSDRMHEYVSGWLGDFGNQMSAIGAGIE
jgi:hypothetical protein